MIPSWASSRRSHDQSQSDSSSSSPDATTRRSGSIDATPRQTPAPNTRFLANASTQDLADIPTFSTSVLSSNGSSSTRRLGLFADKLGSASSFTSSSKINPKPSSSLLHPNGQVRAESTLAISRESASSPVPSISTTLASSSTSTLNKLHASPSKASSGRTYDSKLVSREMQRLGSLAHLPPSLGAGSLAAASSTSLVLPVQSSLSSTGITSAPNSENPWSSLHVHVLPLFNGEPLRIPIEDLNNLVRRHIQVIVAQNKPPKVQATLVNDASELIASGMVTLNAKFTGLEDDKIIARLVEIWGFFWDQVLPYLEGVLLPLQTDNLLSQLYRNPKARRPSSPTRHNSKGSVSSTVGVSQQVYVDVRAVALCSFRDRVILPLFSRLHLLLSMPNREEMFSENSGYQQPRFQQMLLVLVSQARTRPSTLSLTERAPQPTEGETAIAELLHVLRTPQHKTSSSRSLNYAHSTYRHTQINGLGSSSFLSGAVRGDRRGRVAHKQNGGSISRTVVDSGDDDDDAFGDGADTPRNGFGGSAVEKEREKERELLDALRSPVVDNDHHAARMSLGGWGLGGEYESIRHREEDEEDDNSFWDDTPNQAPSMLSINSLEKS